MNHSRASVNQDGGDSRYTYFVCLVAAVGGLLFGFDTAVISGAIPFIKIHFGLNAVQEGWAVSNVLIGCMAGVAFAGYLSDRYGRKNILISAAMLFIVSAVISALPRNLTEFVIARFIGGVAVGIASMLSPVYIAEIAPAHIRGRLVSVNEATIVGGQLVAYISNYLLVGTGVNNWRWMFLAEAVPAALFLGALFVVPESPRWLTKRGQTGRAMEIFTRVGGVANAEREMAQVKEMMGKEEGTLSELFRPGLRKVLFVGIMLAIFQQITGINIVLYYAPKIFIQAGFESMSGAFLAAVLIGVTNTLFTFVAILKIDHYGRKPLLLGGLVGMCLSFVFAGYVFTAGDGGSAWILLPIILYIAFFAMSFGPVFWVLVSEIFPNKIRGRATSITILMLWISCFIVSQTFPWLIETFGGKSFYFYAAINVAAFVFVLFMVTETKGKTLEEIEQMWGG